MKVDGYSFGRITIDGKTYTSDVIIFQDRVDPSWWRKEGHLLQAEDLSDIVNAAPSVLVIGTGAYGTMKVPEKTLDHLRSQGMTVHVEKTALAVELYNSLSGSSSPVAALHLTC